jgi:hypothetical protein
MMLKKLLKSGIIVLSIVFMAACSNMDTISPRTSENQPLIQTNTTQANARMGDHSGVSTANGWYQGEEIYYIDLGIEDGVTQRGENDIYVIGEPRKYQAQVVEFLPGEPGYSPHWNVIVVNTAEGKTLADILASPYASDLYDTEGVLFDDVADILGAEEEGLVTLFKPGVVVLCPIVSEKAADAPGNTALSEDFPPFPDTF